MYEQNEENGKGAVAKVNPTKSVACGVRYCLSVNTAFCLLPSAFRLLLSVH
jgi:hypothetical protein